MPVVNCKCVLRYFTHYDKNNMQEVRVSDCFSLKKVNCFYKPRTLRNGAPLTELMTLPKPLSWSYPSPLTHSASRCRHIRHFGCQSSPQHKNKFLSMAMRQIQCRCEVGLSSEHEDDQVDVSSPDQVNDRVPGRLDNVRHRVLVSP